MIHFELRQDKRILILTPEGPLQREDFEKLVAAVDPLIANEGDLTGLLIDAPAFPGWEGFGDMVSHFKFVKSHERHIRKVALVSDSKLLSLAPHLAKHFLHAEVRHFPSGEQTSALAWITAGEKPA